MKREDSIIYSNKLCENDVHDYIISEVYTGGTIYRCTKCGKIKHTSTLYPEQKEEMDMAKDKTLSTFLEIMDVSKWNMKKETIKKFVEDVFAYYGLEYLKNIINNDELFYDVCKLNKRYQKVSDKEIESINVDLSSRLKETLDDSEYVLLDPAQTATLYSNTLELTNSKDEMIQFEKDVVYVRRDGICDLLFGDEIMVAMQYCSESHTGAISCSM